MKKIIRSLFGAALLVAASTHIHAQGFIYDQESADNPIAFNNPSVDFLDIQPEALTQSFIPTLSAIGFVQLEFIDPPDNGANGATVYVNLWAGSPDTNSATLLGSTEPVYMPNGFGYGYGVTNFYFSTPITLIAGQTYYLQPVVQSGDDPWDIMVLTNTYPNGELFASGDALQPGSDLWFQEGIVAVPEPATLALIGLSGILAYAFKRRFKLLILLGAGILFFGFAHAQTTPDSIVQVAAESQGLQLISYDDLPPFATYYEVMPGGIVPPMPCPPFDQTLPVYTIVDGIFLVDATGGQVGLNAEQTSSTSTVTADLASLSNAVVNLTTQVQTEVASRVMQMRTTHMSMDSSFPPAIGGGGGSGGGIGGITGAGGMGIDTNGLWLESLDEDPTNLWLRLHGTVENDNYQLLYVTNLLCTNWELGEIFWFADPDYIDYSPVPMANAAAAFFQVHHADPVSALWDTQDSIEPNPTNSDPGQPGIVSIYNENEPAPTTNDITVYYTVSGGTAQSGIDYSNLSGVLTIPAGQWSADIVIQPIADGLKPDQTIVLTLIQNTNYLIDPDYVSITNTLYANPEVVPTARGDTEFPCPNTPWTIYLNGHDPFGLPLTYTIQTWPIYGTLDTNELPYVTYTPTNCYEGSDSFTFNVNDGQNTSATATVNLIISSQVYANPVSAQTCRGQPVGVYLSGGTYCDEAVSYALLSSPSNGTLSGTSPFLTYTPTGTNFTGTDSFNYEVIDECGYSATNTVTITLGDPNIYPSPQTVMTGTNQPVTITLSAADNDSCVEASNYLYTIISGPSDGTLSGTPPNVIYTPNPNFEGVDSFQFNVSDGVWTSTNSATVTNYVVAGPILMLGCNNPFGTGAFVVLNWGLDDTVQVMEEQYNFISDYKIYRSSVSGGPYTCIYTNTDTTEMSYTDTNVVDGQTNYYVVTFEFTDNDSHITYESPLSNEILATGQHADDLIPPDATWDVMNISSNSPPIHLGNLQAPFSSEYPNQYPGLNPWPNTYWPAASNGVYSVWSNNIVLVIPTNIVDLSQVQYSIAIDNNYWLYLNGSNIDTLMHDGFATWGSFQTLSPGLHQGTNNIGVVIEDTADIDYFSMVVTTNTCGQ